VLGFSAYVSRRSSAPTSIWALHDLDDVTVNYTNSSVLLVPQISLYLRSCVKYEMLSITKFFALLVLLVSSISTDAFVQRTSGLDRIRTVPSSSTPQQWNSALSERRWNFNDGQAPWGLKKNAEIWNGRVAQVCQIYVPVFVAYSPPTPASMGSHRRLSSP